MAARARIAEQLAQQRMAVQLRRAKTFPKQFESATRLLNEGEYQTACLIFQRLALSRPRSEFSDAASRQLFQLQGSVRQQMERIEQQFENVQSSTPSGDEVVHVIQQYDDLLQKYSGVPVVNREMEKRVSKLRRDPKLVAVVDEAEAFRLLTLGQEFEEDSALCCAHEVYTDATSFLPSHSAEKASGRLKALGQDESLTDSIATCHRMQLCHEKFQLAEMCAELLPEEAEKHYRWILENAPKDSSVYAASASRFKAR